MREAERAKLGRIERRTGMHRHAAAIAVDCIPPTLPLPFPILPPLFLLLVWRLRVPLSGTVASTAVISMAAAALP